MPILNILETKSTPYINFDDERNVLEIKGESYPENTVIFYAQVFSWLDEYLVGVSGKTVTVNLQINYFNSSSSKVLMDFFDRLEDSAAKGTHIAINWSYHEENDMALEYGEDFQDELKHVSFNLISFGG